MRKLTEKQYEFLSDATDLLDKRESDPPHQCWLTGDGQDQGFSYCRDCLEPEIGPAVEEWDGGYSGGESDGVELCECCGCLLDYTLTNYGVSSELEHFSDFDSFDWENADQCYELARIAHGIYENPDQERTLINVLLKGKNFPKELKQIRAPKCHEHA